MVGWEKFTLKAGGQVQSTGESRCAAADNDTHPVCVVAVSLPAAKAEEYVIYPSRKRLVK